MNNVNQSDYSQSNTLVSGDEARGLIDVGAMIKIVFDNIKILSALMTLSVVAACICCIRFVHEINVHDACRFMCFRVSIDA